MASPMTLSFNARNNVIKEIVKFEMATLDEIADCISNTVVMDLSLEFGTNRRS